MGGIALSDGKSNGGVGLLEGDDGGGDGSREGEVVRGGEGDEVGDTGGVGKGARKTFVFRVRFVVCIVVREVGSVEPLAFFVSSELDLSVLVGGGTTGAFSHGAEGDLGGFAHGEEGARDGGEGGRHGGGMMSELGVEK